MGCMALVFSSALPSRIEEDVLSIYKSNMEAIGQEDSFHWHYKGTASNYSG